MERLVSTCAMTLIVRSRAPGTSISTLQIRGTSLKPSSRAEPAGKAALRSGLTVKMTEITSAGVSWLALSISRRSSLVATPIASAELAYAWVAPRTALTLDIGKSYPLPSFLCGIYNSLNIFNLISINSFSSDRICDL